MCLIRNSFILVEHVHRIYQKSTRYECQRFTYSCGFMGKKKNAMLDRPIRETHTWMHNICWDLTWLSLN